MWEAYVIQIADDYLSEMLALVESAHDKWDSLNPQPAIYAISIWTDVQAASSVLAIQTPEHARDCLAALRAQIELFRKGALERGDFKIAEMFDHPIPRHVEPADFKYRSFCEVQHKPFEFEVDPGEIRKFEASLVPLLIKVRDKCALAFAGFPVDPGAEVAISSDRDWYDLPVPIGTPCNPRVD